VKALEKMAATIRRVESWSLNKIERYHDNSSEYHTGEEHSAIARASCEAADKIKAKAIVCLTLTGSIARLISRWRPNSLIIAISPSYDVIRRLSLHWGVYGMRNPLFYDTDILLQDLPELLKELKIVDSGDKIVVTAGIPLNSNCSTNMIKINEIP
jgi:pyruvate kinase